MACTKHAVSLCLMLGGFVRQNRGEEVGEQFGLRKGVKPTDASLIGMNFASG